MKKKETAYDWNESKEPASDFDERKTQLKLMLFPFDNTSTLTPIDAWKALIKKEDEAVQQEFLAKHIEHRRTVEKLNPRPAEILNNKHSALLNRIEYLVDWPIEYAFYYGPQNPEEVAYLLGIYEHLNAIKTGEATRKRYSEFRQIHIKKRECEWKKYAPWMSGYFTRNKTHCLTDGRRACAKYFNVSLSTIKTHTRGYKKVG